MTSFGNYMIEAIIHAQRMEGYRAALRGGCVTRIQKSWRAAPSRGNVLSSTVIVIFHGKLTFVTYHHNPCIFQIGRLTDDCLTFRYWTQRPVALWMITSPFAMFLFPI